MRIAIDLDGVVFNSEMFFMASGEIYDAMILRKNSVIKADEPRVQDKYAWTKEELDGYISRYANSTEFDVMPCAKIVIDALSKENELYVISARGQFNPDEITMDAELSKDLGINSIELADLLMLCEDKFNIEISEEDSNKFITVGDVVNYLETL